MKDQNKFEIMKKITIDILNDKALDLLHDLELLKIIRIRKEKRDPMDGSANLVAKYKGSMSKQPLIEVDKQLIDLRNEWE